MEAGHRNPRRTDLARSVLPAAHPLQGVFDVCQFPALHLGQLRTDFVPCGVERRIDDVPRRIAMEFAEERHIARQGAAERIPATNENSAEV